MHECQQSEIEILGDERISDVAAGANNVFGDTDATLREVSFCNRNERRQVEFVGFSSPNPDHFSPVLGSGLRARPGCLLSQEKTQESTPKNSSGKD